jgi:hypothetical protein
MKKVFAKFFSSDSWKFFHPGGPDPRIEVGTFFFYFGRMLGTVLDSTKILKDNNALNGRYFLMYRCHIVC